MVYDSTKHAAMMLYAPLLDVIARASLFSNDEVDLTISLLRENGVQGSTLDKIVHLLYHLQKEGQDDDC